MSTMASQFTSLMIVNSTVYSGADQRKHRSSASPAFVWGIHRWPVNSPHKWPVTRKMFPFDDVIMALKRLWIWEGKPCGFFVISGSRVMTNITLNRFCQATAVSGSWWCPGAKTWCTMLWWSLWRSHGNWFNNVFVNSLGAHQTKHHHTNCGPLHDDFISDVWFAVLSRKKYHFTDPSSARRPLRNFAHTTTAQLSKYVQNYASI